MSSPLQILKQYGIDPKRSRGQNFLIDKNIVDKIISHADLQKSDVVVEIGAGAGVLTERLAQKAHRVYAVEIDKALTAILQEKFSLPTVVVPETPVVLLSQDIRRVANTAFADRDFTYRVIANIPYNLTSLLIRKFLEEKPRPSDMIIMVQYEVAQRVCAKPTRMNLLAAMTQYYGEPHVLFKVSRGCFYPKPKVDSAVIRIVLDVKRDPENREARAYTQCVKAGFSAARKLLASNLSGVLHIPRTDVATALASVGIAPKARAQELSVQQWESLTLSTVHDISAVV